MHSLSCFNSKVAMELTLDQALQKGVEAHKAGKAQEADQYYTAILKANPKHPDANHNMGVLAVGVGKVEEALSFFKTALEINPNIAQYWLSYMDALVRLNRIDDAKAVLDQARDKGVRGDGFDQLEKQLAEIGKDVQVSGGGAKSEEPRTEQLQNLINLYTQGQYQTAQTQASQLLKQFPNSVNLYNIIGVTDKELGNLNEAIDAYNKALSIRPNVAEVYNNIGNALKDQSKLEDAIDAYKKALSIKPDYADAYNNMGNTLNKQCKLEEAIEAYNKALSINPNNAEAYNNMGIALTEQRRLEEAIEAYTKALSIKPDYVNACYNMGITLKDQGKLEEAIEAYNKALSIKPDYADANINMGAALQEQGKLDEAIEAYNKALSINPDNAEAYNNMGNALKEQDKLDEAIEAYNKALSIKPDYAEAYNNMGVILQDKGKLDEAIEAYTNALSIKPDFAKAYYNMGNPLKDQGKLDEAIEAYNKALSINPDNAEAIVDASSLRNQILGTELINEEFEKRLENHNHELLARPKFQINQAVRAFLISDQKLVRKHLNSYSSCPPSSITELKAKDRVFCSAYKSFLQKLIKTPFENEATFADDQTVFHIGESHCLSYAHRLIKIHGMNYTVTPRITFGGKAYHFSTEKENAFKAITKANFHSLPDSSKVFISFGEIDCRQNEGFISAAAKHKKPIANLVSDTVRGYVDWFAEQNQSKNHSLFFFNVPAPFYNKKYSTEVNGKVKSTIKLFNNLLSSTVLDYDLNIIDVYKFTFGHDEFSNGSFHIDNRHLSSDAIPEIEKQIGTFL